MWITVLHFCGCTAPRIGPAASVVASVYAQRPPSVSIAVVNPSEAHPGVLIADLVASGHYEMEGAIKQAMHAKAMELGGSVLVFLPVEMPANPGATIRVHQEVTVPSASPGGFAAGLESGSRSVGLGSSYAAEMRAREDRNRRVFRAQVFGP